MNVIKPASYSASNIQVNLDSALKLIESTRAAVSTLADGVSAAYEMSHKSTGGDQTRAILSGQGLLVQQLLEMLDDFIDADEAASAGQQPG